MTTTTKRNGRTTPRKPRALAPVPTEPAVPLTAAPDGKLRLLKVLVQPTFVLVQEDGNVQEIAHPTVEIKGVDWSTWAPEVFSDDALEVLRTTITPIQPT